MKNPKYLRSVSIAIFTIVLWYNGLSAVEPFKYRDIICTTNVAPLKTLVGRPISIVKVSFSIDGKHLAALSDGAVYLWDVSHAKSTFRIQEHKSRITDLQFSPDGKLLGTVSEWAHTGKLWDPLNGQLVRTFTWRYRNPEVKRVQLGDIQIESWTPGWHYRCMEQIAFSPDSNELATPGYCLVALDDSEADTRGEIRLWDSMTGRPIFTLPGQKSRLLVVSYSVNGRQIAAGSRDGRVLIWHTKTGKQLATFQASSFAISCLSFSPDGKHLATAGVGGQIKVWDLMQHGIPPIHRFGESTRFKTDHRSVPLSMRIDAVAISAIAWSPDSRYIVASASQGSFLDRFAFITVLDSKTGEQRINFGTGKKGYSGAHFSFGRNGKYLATAHSDGTVKIWDFAALVEDSISKKKRKIEASEEEKLKGER